MNIINAGYDSANYYLLETQRGKLMVDCGWPGTLPRLNAVLKRKGSALSELRYLVVTHFHPDHAGLTQELKNRGVKLVLLESQRPFIAPLNEFFQTKDYPYVEIQEKDNLHLEFEQSRVFLAGLGVPGEILSTPGHSDDSITLILDEGFAFTGDLHPRFMVPEDDHLSRESWDRIYRHQITQIYPGHGSGLGSANGARYSAARSMLFSKESGMHNFLNEAKELFPYTRSLRRDLHMHPELGFREIRTGGIVAAELESLGIEVTKGIGKTGIVGVLECTRPGPTLLIRFDMDALPIHEETGAEYASRNAGVMHACGHDGHVAIGLSVAKILHAHRPELSGTIKFVFQPAEEGLCGEEVGGAEMMIRQGVLEDPRPDFALSMHIWNEEPLGWVNAAAGPVMAGVEQFKIRVVGRGGHGAIPDQAVDPVVAAAQIITALQSIAARNVNPLDAAVVSVTMVHGGSAFNVIPKDVELEGTIRTFSSAVREKVLQRFDEIATGVGTALGCQVEVHNRRLSPAMINDATVAARVQAVARRLLPEADHSTSQFVTMGGEDMAFMLEKIPGCYFFVGSNNTARGLDHGHHHPRFDFDEDVLWHSTALMASAAAEILTSP